MGKAARARPRPLQAELYRKGIEFQRKLRLWLVLSVIVYVGAFALGRGLTGRTGLTAAIALAGWSGALSASASVSAEIAQSRRNATIALRIGTGIGKAFLPNCFYAALGEVALGALVLPIIWGVVSVFDHTIVSPVPILLAYAVGVVCGLCVGPAIWSASLFARSPEWIGGMFGLIFFVWTTVGSRPSNWPLMRVIGHLSPIAPLSWSAWSPIGILIWGAFWLAIAAVSLAVSFLLLRFVREGGDIIIDA